MKDDYLWDKTGEDAEIRGLENALQAFRFQENAPPELPQKVFTVERESGRKFFRFGFAFAAFAGVVIVCSVVWFQLSGSHQTPVAEIASVTSALERTEKIADDSFIESRAAAPVKSIETAPPVVNPNVVKIRQKSAPVGQRNRAVLRKI